MKVLLGSLWPSLIVDETHADKVYPLGQHYAYLLEESGYMHLQATKPDTLGKSGKCRIYSSSFFYEITIVFYLINTHFSSIFCEFCIMVVYILY
jgi:hypothetical protein